MKFGDAVVKTEGLPTPYDPMTTRNQLHISKLGDFTLWLMAHGWQYQPAKGEYEVLRMTKESIKGPLLVYSRLASKEHLTVYGHSDRWFNKWMKSMRFKTKEAHE